MRKEYDFSQSRQNPHTKPLKRQVTIRLDTVSVEYFKKLAGELGMPYQNLINLFLRDCAVHKRRPAIDWQQDAPKRQVVAVSPTKSRPARDVRARRRD